ncbi:MAG: bifunctional sugar-1-phosphate nucleotidylyltransferase/acetyltransferase [Thermoplasmata archaeon]
MKAFLLAAGEGTRMRPLTAHRPKPLLPVAGKPFLGHIFERLETAGISSAVVLLGWRGRLLKDHFAGRTGGMTLAYVEQEPLEGTASAIALAEGHVGSRFLCLNGDVIFDAQDLKAMLKAHGKGKRTVMAVAKTEHPELFGTVTLEEDRLVSLEEKPTEAASPWVNAGIYLFNDEVFGFIRETPRSPRGEYEITDTLKLLLQEGEVGVHRLEGPWLDVGYPWDLLKANELLLQGIEPEVAGEVENGAVLQGRVRVEEGARVRSGAVIEGPVLLDRGSHVGPNCYLRPATYVGPGARVGNACEIKNSILMTDAHVPHHSYVGDSIIGEACNLGSGTKVANLRLDGRRVSVTIKGRRVETGLRKLGVIMGDRVKTGVNVSIDVGTIIGEETAIGPGASVRGNIAPKSRIY